MEKNSPDTMITQDLFEELLQTGALDLSSDEAGSLFRDLNGLMRIIRQLDTIPDSEDFAPVIHGNPYPPEIRCGLREDVPASFESPADIIGQAPAHRDDFIISPDVPHQRIG